MKYGYIRTSPLFQETIYSFEEQKNALLKHNIREENIYCDRNHGEPGERAALERLKKELHPGDRLYVTHLDRLGRTLPEMISLVNELHQQNITVLALNLPITQDQSMQFLFLRVFDALDQFEKIRKRERQAQGRSKPKVDTGGLPGRKSVLTEHLKTQILESRFQGQSAIEIARRLGISRSTVYQVLKQVKTQNHLLSSQQLP